jgi:two-component system, NarL family, nitrate/nitrite response regulator NarL
VGSVRAETERPRQIRVVVGDAHPEFRRAFRVSLSAASDIEVIAETDDGLAALDLLRKLRPHVALLDADLPSLGGSAVARVLARELPEVHVVVLEA